MGKISSYTELTSLASGDLIPVVDVSDTSMAASGTTKYAQYSNIQAGQLTDAPTISSGLAPPASTPAKVGDLYVDTATPSLWYAVGTTDSDDWVLTGSSGGGSGSVTLYVWGTFASTVAQTDASYEWHCPQSATLDHYGIWCATAPTTASVIADLEKDGTSVMAVTPANRATIATSSKRGKSGAPDTVTMAEGDVFEVVMDQLNVSDEGNLGQVGWWIAYNVST